MQNHISLTELLPEGRTDLDRLSGSKKEIVVALKVHGELTVDELSSLIRITPSGIRQQLGLLESEGLIAYEEIGETRAGRRRRRYRLQAAALKLFPGMVEDVAQQLFAFLRRTDPATIERFVEEYAGPRVDALRDHIDNRPTGQGPEAALTQTSERMRHSGFLPVIGGDPAARTLELNHCPWGELVEAVPGICEIEHRMFEKTMPGATVTREKHLVAGDRNCCYRITMPLERA